MKKIIKRLSSIKRVKELLGYSSAVAILGPRQCGKTFLAKQLGADHYFDLENPRDLALLATPQLALEGLKGRIVIDEVQRAPELFPLLRYLIDTNSKQKYILLGSAAFNISGDSSESLAGRIGFYYLNGFGFEDVGTEEWRRLWLVGGFPKAYLAGSVARSFGWLHEFISTFLERDLKRTGIALSPVELRRFWTMLCHYHGNTIKYAEVASVFGISDMTVRKYVDLLAGAHMIRLLHPWHVNIAKRIVKLPKIYIRDTGILHALLSVNDQTQLLSHPKMGMSWEGFVIEAVARTLNKRPEELYFFGIHAGMELDLFWQANGKNWGIEVKYADAPVATASMKKAIETLDLEKLWVVYPGSKRYRVDEHIEVLPITQVGSLIKEQ